jgi:hypothetical protein
LKKRPDSTLGYQSEENKIIVKLRADIDALHLHTNGIKDSILDLARYLNENKIFERNQICRRIKEKLQDKIKEGKITEKWIEECLPQEYKRRYTKSEVSSVSNENKQGQVLCMITPEAETYAEQEFETNERKASTDPTTNRLQQGEIDEFERCIIGLEISENPVQFSIPRKKYKNLEAAMKESNNAIYAVFKNGIFQYVYSDNAQI